MKTYRVVHVVGGHREIIGTNMTQTGANDLRRALNIAMTDKEASRGDGYWTEEENAEENEGDDKQAKQLIAAAVLAEQVGAKWFAFETAKVVGDIALILRIEREGM